MGPELRRRLRRVGVLLGVCVSLLALSSCSSKVQDQITRLGMPTPATDRADDILELWYWSWLAAILVGILVWGLILYASFKFRRKREDEVPAQVQYHLPIEMLYTLAPVVMVLVFFYFTVVTQNQVLAKVENPDHHIHVVGQQWQWTFNYMDEEATAGTTVHTVGTADQPPTLWLPVNDTVKISLTSPDVVHSFWVPAFMFKLDVFPGRTNTFSFTPTRIGTYSGKCAELCGTYHSRMIFNVKIVSDQKYREHLRQLKAAGQTGEVTGSSFSETVEGLETSGQGSEGGTP